MEECCDFQEIVNESKVTLTKKKVKFNFFRYEEK